MNNDRKTNVERSERGKKKYKNKIIKLYLCMLAVMILFLGFAIKYTLKIDANNTESKPYIKATDGIVETTTPKIVNADVKSETTTPEETTQEETTKASNGLTVYIDAGHGGKDSGCYYDKIYEKDLTYAMALKLKKKLTDHGYKAVLREDPDHYYTLNERSWLCQQSGADAFISIHVNSQGEDENHKMISNGVAKGIITYYYEEVKSKKLAEDISKEMINVSKCDDLGVEKQPYVVLTNSSIPSTLIETGFLSNKSDRELLQTDDYQNKLMEGVVRGIDKFFKI